MGKFAIQIKALLENCTNLRVSGADYIWSLKLRCTACGESTQKWHTVNPLDTFPMAGGKGKANLIIKCKMCGRSNSVNMCVDFLTAYTSEDSEQFKTIVVVEGRGIEPYEFLPNGEFVCEGTVTGTAFKGIALDSGDWADFDDASNLPVGIYDCNTQIVPI
ncbi:hypothetical protein LOD99_6119 [Oopsacas minuta]|uniref:CXXC motif containing zinc binding protein n=1 Tax=Oopsacas minuta TaxID=111878 RepID=A0AAV7JN04_9METZ|nr:hypothetical protein LOD99_6119 [Oopsacas minuta]